jgi:hypothetical protein
MMNIKSIYIIGWIVVLAMTLISGTAFAELKSLDDAELSFVEAEGVTAAALNNPTEVAENSGVLSVSAGDAAPFDLNDPNREPNAFRPPAVNNNAIVAPQSQFNTFNQTPSCCSGRSNCP